MIKNVIFDVDGTLWDSTREVAESWNAVLEKKYPSVLQRRLTAEDMYRNMGKTMTDIGLNLFPKLPDVLRDEIMKDVMAYENEYLRQHAGKFYPGLQDTLGKLRKAGCRLYIVSNCQDGYIQALLSHAEQASSGTAPQPSTTQDATLASYFDDFECFGRTGLTKDGSIRILMERNHLLPEETVYVGDTGMDEAAARKAGIRFIHAAYGFGTAAAPDAVISSIMELPAVVQNSPGRCHTFCKSLKIVDN